MRLDGRRAWGVGALAASAVTGVEAQQAPPRIDPAAVAVVRDGMVLVPAGEFKMGSQPSDHWAENDELPQRVVQLPAFYIDQLEVTNLQYKRFVIATGWPQPLDWTDNTYAEDADFLPVTGVNWWDATAYARWAGKRLPTEAEWEKAARGGDARRFPWGDEFTPDHANNDKSVLPAGSKPLGASPFGVLDMAGNVAEWTASVYAPYPKIEAILPGEFGGTSAAGAGAPAVGAASPDAGAPAGRARRIQPDDPRLGVFTIEELQDERPRVYRGGSFNSFARFLRCANRQGESPGSRWPNIGFRCAADAGGGTAP